MKNGKGMAIAKNVSHGILGGSILALGIVMLCLQNEYMDVAMFLVSLTVIIAAASQAVIWFLQKVKKPVVLVLELVCVALGFVMMFIPQIPGFLIPVLFSAYLLLNGAIKTVDTALIIKNKAPDLLFSLLPALFYLTFAVIILFSPLHHLRFVFIVVGIYCILLGGTYLLDFLHSMIPGRARAKIKRHMRVCLPIFFAAFVPHFVLEGLNRFLSEESGRRPDQFEDINEKKEEVTPDMEMFIHVANDRFVMTMGHCDISFDGELISYGNYDDASATPIGTGDGVLLIDKKETYIPFCLEYNKTTIFGFGLRLTEEQKESIRRRIREIKEQVYPWEPPYVHEKEVDPEGAAVKEYKEFSNALCRADGAKFFKFRGGKFKTYFVMSTNCVLLADSIVCQAGTHILDMTGIISPGTFYEYLEAEFLRKGSMVVSRTVYSLDKNLKIKKD